MMKPINLQVIYIIIVIDDEVANVVEVDFINEPLVGSLWNLGSEEI